MRRILFVDDEPRILEGLQNLLRRCRREWEMRFATSGEEALALMAAEPFDVIVTDMRMPRMDGAELLRRVQESHPRTVRIVLSGQTEHEVARRLVHTAHQFLAKPCDGPFLQEVIERSCNLNNLLHDDSLRSMVGHMGQLPAVPGILAELNRVLESPQSSLRSVAAVVERDPALCAKVLQLVNSAFFGLAQRAKSVESAVSYLGIDTLKGLAMMIEVMDFAEGPARIQGFSIESVGTHSLLTARIAKWIGQDRGCGADAFVAGMLHDVGLLILAARMPEELARILDAARSGERSLCDVEAELLRGVSHAEIGAYLLGLWGLPLPVVEAVAFHHAPARANPSGFDLLGVVHVADALAHEVAHEGEEGRSPLAAVDEEYLAAAGVLERLPVWRGAAASLVPRMEVS